MEPKHETLRYQLLEMIEGLEPGTQIPPERALGGRFGVARETLRRSLDALSRDGYLVRRQGAGTFVARPKISQQFELRSFSEDMHVRGMASSSRILWHRTGPAGARLAARLRISPQDEILTMQRLRLADDEPMALELLNVPTRLIPNFEPESLEHQSFYRLLRAGYDISIGGATQTMEPSVTDAKESELLTVPPFSPALLVERVTWSTKGDRFEAVTSLYRGDRYKFHMSLSGSSEEDRTLG